MASPAPLRECLYEATLVGLRPAPESLVWTGRPAAAAAAGRCVPPTNPLARVPVVERRSAVVTARVSAAEVERERTRQVERIGHNLVVYAPLSP